MVSPCEPSTTWMEVFADELRALGEVLPAVATAQELKRLAEYAGAAQYPGWAGQTTEADAARFCEIAAQGYERARERAPQILQAHEPPARSRAQQDELVTTGRRAPRMERLRASPARTPG